MTVKPHTPNDTMQIERDSVPFNASTLVRFNVFFLNRKSQIPNRKSTRGFTLVEMLTVIAIIAIVAGLAVPLLKNYGKSNVNVTASRQLLDDIGRARQLAMANRTTVYMVFVPSNYWTLPDASSMFSGSGLTTTQMLAGSNLLDKQFTGYISMSYGALGDQPGRHQWHYLSPWQSLPAGAYIPLFKFNNPSYPQPFIFSDPVTASTWFNIYAFNYTNTFPFPTQDSVYTSPKTPPYLPYIAFNYLGQLSDYSGNLLSTSTSANRDQDFIGGGIDIPLSQGSVMYYQDTGTKALQVGPPQVVEQPPGNTTNISYNVVHIDPITGRATLQYHKMQ